MFLYECNNILTCQICTSFSVTVSSWYCESVYSPLVSFFSLILCKSYASPLSYDVLFSIRWLLPTNQHFMGIMLVDASPSLGWYQWETLKPTLCWLPLCKSPDIHYSEVPWPLCGVFNTLRPRQNGRHFADATFKRIFLNDNVRISIKISLKFPKGPIINIPALVQIMAWRRLGDKPLSEPMLVSLLTHICVNRPQWVNKRKGLVLLYSVAVFFTSTHSEI